MRILLLLMLTGFTLNAYAQSGGPKDLCTTSAKGPQISNRYCEMLKTALDDDTNKTLLGQLGAAAASKPLAGMSDYCPNFDQLNGDLVKRALVIQNVLAAMIGAESAWNHKAVFLEDNTSGFCGIRDSFYESKAVFKAEPNFEKQCGTAPPKDPQAQLKCCAYIALYAMTKDNAFAGRDKGLSRYFGVFNPSGAPSTLRNRLKSTIRGYCQDLSSGQVQSAEAKVPGTID